VPVGVGPEAGQWCGTFAAGAIARQAGASVRRQDIDHVEHDGGAGRPQRRITLARPPREVGGEHDERDAVDPRMSLAALKTLIETRYGWALKVDYEDPRQRYLFWYRSAEKDEPRLGERFNEPGAERELPLGIGLMAAALHRALAALPAEALSGNAGEFLLEQPRWRGILRRIQSLAPLPYGEIQDNLLGEACLPIDLLRCKLAIFGAAKFDPKSDRWTRITLFQGAPSIEELADPDADDWAFPAFPL